MSAFVVRACLGAARRLPSAEGGRMGLLVDGVWHDRWYDTATTGGRFVRSAAGLRDAISAAPDAAHPAAPGRYRLYVAAACPWAHRTLLYRVLKGLEGVLSVSYVTPVMGSEGWVFDEAHPEPLHGAGRLYELYVRARPDYSGRVTVPLLWDELTDTAVSNESAEIVRMLDRHFSPWADPTAPYAHTLLCPEELAPEIDTMNRWIHETVNDGVYKAGFATSQAAYDEAVGALFDSLDTLDDLLGRQRWLLGDRLTESDVRLFPTLLRFDPVYHQHFKCSRRRLVDYPNLWDYTRAIYQLPGVRRTVNLPAVREHYFRSHPSINPHRIVPLGPELDLDAPHDRFDRSPESDR